MNSRHPNAFSAREEPILLHPTRRSSVVISRESRSTCQPKVMARFDSLTGWGEKHYFCPSESANFFVPDPPSPYGTPPNLCGTAVKLKISAGYYPSGRERVGLKSRWYGNMKTLRTQDRGKKVKKLGSTVLWLLAFPREKTPNFSCTGTRKLSNLI